MAKYRRQTAARAKTGEKRRGALPSQPSNVPPLSVDSGLQVGHLEGPEAEREAATVQTPSC